MMRPGIAAKDNVSLVLFESIDFSLEDLYDILLDSELSVLRQGNNLAVWLENGPLLFITLSADENVRLESANIGLDTTYVAELDRCCMRIEIAFDDLEEVRSEAETLVEVQALLQEATQGYIFNRWNGRLAPPPGYDQ